MKNLGKSQFERDFEAHVRFDRNAILTAAGVFIAALVIFGMMG